MSEVKPSFITHAVLQRQPDRDALQSDVELFLAKGGKIQQLAPGQVSQLSEEDIKAARRKEALRQHHRNKRAEREDA